MPRWSLPSLAMLCAALFCASPGWAVEIVGHRGASHDAPENTLASVNLAWKQKADAAEIDIYLSKDGKIVAIHDDTTKRTAGKDLKVVAQTLAELKTLDAGAWKDAKFTGERIPTLPEVLATIPDGKRLFIEIKCGPEVVPALKQTLHAAGKSPAQTPVIGFDYNTVREVKRAMPELKVYWIVSLKQDKQTGLWGPPRDELIQKARSAGVDGLDLGSVKSVDRAYVEAVKKAGLELYCWTINDADEAHRVTEIGFDGITTDRPGWIREQLGDQRR